jgi:hypothetical protein
MSQDDRVTKSTWNPDDANRPETLAELLEQAQGCVPNPDRNRPFTSEDLARRAELLALRGQAPDLKAEAEAAAEGNLDMRREWASGRHAKLVALKDKIDAGIPIDSSEFEAIADRGDRGRRLRAIAAGAMAQSARMQGPGENARRDFRQAERAAIRLLEKMEENPRLALLGTIHGASLLGAKAADAVSMGMATEDVRSITIDAALRGFLAELQFRLETEGHEAADKRLHLARAAVEVEPDISARELLEVAIAVGAEDRPNVDDEPDETFRMKRLEGEMEALEELWAKRLATILAEKDPA